MGNEALFYYVSAFKLTINAVLIFNVFLFAFSQKTFIYRDNAFKNNGIIKRIIYGNFKWNTKNHIYTKKVLNNKNNHLCYSICVYVYIKENVSFDLLDALKRLFPQLANSRTALKLAFGFRTLDALGKQLCTIR